MVEGNESVRSSEPGRRKAQNVWGLDAKASNAPDDLLPVTLSLLDGDGDDDV